MRRRDSFVGGGPGRYLPDLPHCPRTLRALRKVLFQPSPCRPGQLSIHIVAQLFDELIVHAAHPWNHVILLPALPSSPSPRLTALPPYRLTSGAPARSFEPGGAGIGGPGRAAEHRTDLFVPVPFHVMQHEDFTRTIRKEVYRRLDRDPQIGETRRLLSWEMASSPSVWRF